MFVHVDCNNLYDMLSTTCRVSPGSSKASVVAAVAGVEVADMAGVVVVATSSSENLASRPVDCG